MRITVLSENTTCREDFICEHGLSLYIETRDKRILFDAGASSAFAENAEKLGIDLTQVNFAVLSHGHYDHGGGLGRFLEINKTAPVYVSREAFGPHYNGPDKYIGLDPALKESTQLRYTGSILEIAPGITLHSCNDRKLCCPIEPYGLSRMDGGEFLPEDFRHEQYLLVEEQGRRICISGCSHKGILNITHWFRPDILVGGFHFMKIPPESPVLTQAADKLLTYPTAYYTGHCTGQAQFDRLKERMGQRLHRITTGMTFDI